jgi:hypothetical protein
LIRDVVKLSIREHLAIALDRDALRPQLDLIFEEFMQHSRPILRRSLSCRLGRACRVFHALATYLSMRGAPRTHLLR